MAGLRKSFVNELQDIHDLQKMIKISFLGGLGVSGMNACKILEIGSDFVKLDDLYRTIVPFSAIKYIEVMR